MRLFAVAFLILAGACSADPTESGPAAQATDGGGAAGLDGDGAVSPQDATGSDAATPVTDAATPGPDADLAEPGTDASLPVPDAETDVLADGTADADALADTGPALDSEAVNLSIPASEFVVFSLGPKTA